MSFKGVRRQSLSGEDSGGMGCVSCAQDGYKFGLERVGRLASVQKGALLGVCAVSSGGG